MATIKILNGVLDEQDGKVVLRGAIDPDSLENLLVDDYQRDALPLTSLSSVVKAIAAGEVVPDIQLGMRGQRFTERNGCIYLHDPVYIVDGLQRVTAAKHQHATGQEKVVRLGCMLHFDTTKEWERARFRTLNTQQTKVSPNVLLRNAREDSPAVSTFYNLSMEDTSFALRRRVQWGQRMSRQDLISGLTYLKVVGTLHTHKVSGLYTAIDQLVPALDRAVDVVGPQIMRENVRAFFDLIDECWKLRAIQFREGAPQIKGAFLHVVAKFLSDHRDFWRQPDEKRLFVEASLRKKFSLFQVHEPTVTNLAGGSGKARDYLYQLLASHMNSGKRTKRLTSRTGELVLLGEEGPSGGDDEQEAA